MGEYAFSAQYQQSPVPRGGALVKEAWLAYYHPQDVPPKFEKVVQSWDTASKVSEFADYSVCTTWGLWQKEIYLLHVLRRRLEYPELKRLVIDHMAEWEATDVLIEDKSSGIQLVQDLREASPKIQGVVCEGDKIMRLQAQTPSFENGRVLLPKEAPWLREYVSELLAFPMAKYDDQVDSTAQALRWITDLGRVPSIFRYYRREWEKKYGQPWNGSYGPPSGS